MCHPAYIAANQARFCIKDETQGCFRPVATAVPAPPSIQARTIPAVTASKSNRNPLVVISEVPLQDGYYLGGKVLTHIGVQNISGGLLKTEKVMVSGIMEIPFDNSPERDRLEEALWNGLEKLPYHYSELPISVEGKLSLNMETPPLDQGHLDGLNSRTLSVFFAMIVRDSKTKAHLLEVCGYYRKGDITVLRCNRHNKP